MRLLGPPLHGWRRDARVWVAVAFVSYCVAGFAGVPAIVRSQVPGWARRHLGREAQLKRASFNPFTFRGTFEGIELKDRDGTGLLSLDSLDVNFEPTGVFRWAWAFREIRLLGPRITFRLLPDGRPAVADLFERESPAPAPREPFRLPRVVIRRLEIAGGRVDFEDQSVSPRFATTFEPLGLVVEKLSTLPSREGGHQIAVGMEGGAQIRWTGGLTVDPLELHGNIEIDGMRLPRVWEYAGRSQPLDVLTGTARLTIPYVIEKPADGSLRAEVREASCDLRDLAVAARGDSEPWARFPAIEVRGASVRWPEAAAAIDLVRIVEPTARVWVADDGAVNWSDLFAGGTAASAAASPAPAPAGEPAGPAWKASCAALEIASGATRLEDRTVSPPATIDVAGVDVRLENLTSDGSSPVGVTGAARINGTGTVSARGTAGARPVFAELDVDVAGVELAPFQPYVSTVARVKVDSGSAGLRGKIVHREGASPLTRFEGRATAADVSVSTLEGERVVGWSSFAVDEIRLALAPDRLRARRVTIDRPFAKILIDRDGSFNLARLAATGPGSAASADSPAPSIPPASSPVTPFPIEIGSIAMTNGAVDFADLSLILPFATNIHDAKGSVSDLSTSGAAPSRLAFEGKIEEYGFAKADGTLHVFDPYAATDIAVLFRNIEMNRLSPYSAQFAGYKIESGRLDLDINYRIEHAALRGDHRVTATQLTLGEKVEGGVAGLAVRLAVALLKDSEGKIEMDVPIEGTIDSPEFAYRTVVWQAVKRILTNVATAPFRALGRLMGIDGDDLEFVSFEAGRSDLLPPERERLLKVVAEVGKRAELRLAIGGRFDPAEDAAALRKTKLDALIAARRDRIAAAAGDTDDAAPALDRALDELYVEAFSVEARDALRQAHSTAPAPDESPAKRRRGEAVPQPALDAPAYFEAIRAALLEKQEATEEELRSLASRRAESILAAVLAEGGLDPARATAGEVGEVKKKKKKSDDRLVPSQLDLKAE